MAARARKHLLIEQKLVRGQIVAGQKTNRSIRTIKLLAPLAHDLAEYRGQTRGTGLLFPKPYGGAWLDHDFRNWRKRSFRPATEALGIVAARPYDLRHRFASLLIHEGRPLMEIADQLGHSVETLLRYYAHLIAEMAGEPPIPAERAIEKARAEVGRK
jgi:integrase